MWFPSFSQCTVLSGTFYLLGTQDDIYIMPADACHQHPLVQIRIDIASAVLLILQRNSCLSTQCKSKSPAAIKSTELLNLSCPPVPSEALQAFLVVCFAQPCMAPAGDCRGLKDGCHLRAGTTFPSRSFHLIPHISISSADSISSARFHLASRILSISSTPFAGIRPASRVSSTSHLPSCPSSPSHLRPSGRISILDEASRPSHLPSCHLKMEIEIWVFHIFSRPCQPSTATQVSVWYCLLVGSIQIHDLRHLAVQLQI